jgi:hypothetical protein
MSNNSRPVDWLEYIRQAKQKPFDMAQLRCDFPADVIFADGLNSEQAQELFAIDETVDTLPTFSNDRETIVKQAFGYFALEMKLRLYKKELEKNYGVLMTQLLEAFTKSYSSKPMDGFGCDDAIKRIRDYADLVVSREKKEEEYMDTKRIEDELKGLDNV